MSDQLLAFYSFQPISLITNFAIVWIYFYPLKKSLSLENPEEIQNCTYIIALALIILYIRRFHHISICPRSR